MFPKRLSYLLILVAFTLAACTARPIAEPADRVTEPTLGGSATEVIPTAAQAQSTEEVSTTSTARGTLPPVPTSPSGDPATRTPGPYPIATAYVTAPPSPTPDVIGTPGFAWEGPGIIYESFPLDGGINLALSNFDGARKNVVGLKSGIDLWYFDFSPETGTIVNAANKSLWVIKLGVGVQKLMSVEHYIESPVITRDGTKIAYSLVLGFGDKSVQQLWTINADGSGSTLLIDNTSPYITDPGPFRLIPVAWSLDKSKIYMTTTTDSEATPVGMYVVDVAARTVEKANTPQVTLWDLSFSPDRARIAYRTFQWLPVEGSMPVVGPPFTLQVTELSTGETKILQENDTVEYLNPVWSPDGNLIAYTERSFRPVDDLGLFTIDLATGEAVRLFPGSDGRRLRPWAWLSADRLVYTEVIHPSENDSNPAVTLYTLEVNSGKKREIDSAASITVLGVLDEQERMGPN